MNKDSLNEKQQIGSKWSREMGLVPRTLEEKQNEDRQIFDEVSKVRSMTNEELSHARGFVAELERRRRTPWGRFIQVLEKIGIVVFIIFIIWFLYQFLVGYHLVGARHTEEAVAPIDHLTELVAEREWKYKKLEDIEYPQINTYDMLPSLDSFKQKLKSWHDNFEIYRDQWCDTAYSIPQDMGTDTYITDCKIEIELRAITMLNYLYYTGVMQDIRESKGIPDFEYTNI